MHLSAMLKEITPISVIRPSMRVTAGPTEKKNALLSITRLAPAGFTYSETRGPLKKADKSLYLVSNKAGSQDRY